MRRPLFSQLLIVSWLAMLACTGAHEPRREPKRLPQPVVAVAVDVPGLVGLSVDELGRRLGRAQAAPAGFVDPTNESLVQRGVAVDSLALFRCNGVALLAAYDYRSRRVTDLLLLGNDEDALIQRGNLQVSARHYLVLPVFTGPRGSDLLGLRVVPTVLPR